MLSEAPCCPTAPIQSRDLEAQARNSRLVRQQKLALVAAPVTSWRGVCDSVRVFVKRWGDWLQWEGSQFA